MCDVRLLLSTAATKGKIIVRRIKVAHVAFIISQSRAGSGVEGLSSMYKAWSLIPSTKNEKKKKNLK